MGVRIRLKRMGSKRRPCYRVVVADARTPRDGRSVEEIGFYHPIAKEGQQFFIKSERAEQWISRGAQPTAVVKQLLKKSTKI